jgi:hypothetical protein
MTELQLIDNYIYTTKLNLNLSEIRNSSLRLINFVRNNIKDDGTGFNGKQAKGNLPYESKLFSQYNVFMYPFPGFYDLYTEIKNTFHAVKEHQNIPNKPYYCQCWVNVFEQGQFIDWHYHWTPEFHAWHGFYCVDVEPNSKTTYKLENEVDVESKDNLLVISKSAGDLHKSSEWGDPNRPRITIAFDIIPAETLCDGFYDNKLNHWVPI